MQNRLHQKPGTDAITFDDALLLPASSEAATMSHTVSASRTRI